MRTVNAAQTKALQAAERGTYFKVEVQPRGTGAWNDLTNLFGFNFVKSASVTDSIDTPSASMEVNCARKIFDYSLSPFVVGSKLNAQSTLLYPNDPIRLSVCVTEANSGPDTWVKIFYGRIFEIQVAGVNDIKLQCHDYCGQLISLWWPSNSYTFGQPTGGVPAENLMQQLLGQADGAGGGPSAAYSLLGSGYTGPVSNSVVLNKIYSVNGTVGTPFNPSDSPGFQVLFFTQDLMPVYTALQNMASLTGWLLKQKWQNNLGDYALMWFDPLRSNTTPTWTFDPSQYYDITECSIHLGDIRNVIAVPYVDNTGTPQTKFAWDTASINTYGLQFMRMAEEATTALYDGTKAASLANVVLTDLKDPVMTHNASVPLFWPVEICDVYTFKANGEHYDSNQTLAVQSYTHNFTTQGKSTTELSLSGRPSAGQRVWIDRQMINIRRQFGANNQNLYTELSGNLYPNGLFGQVSGK